ncbi:MAG TPA: hypothetical protein VE954_33005 [Oligoflexus sp.]|uniref:hypothetical protein n=1 Tax=Oligoflexus sp. TaxID=1971216 RepID=UPI002D58AA70|nr:hypothetical protein [Oligoflexus sp.]HYX37945.1 hypothetical protein [Oligoflexus sp.]
MKHIIIKGILLGALLVFLFKGGIRVLMLGWRFIVPALMVTVVYFVVRQVIQKKKVGARQDPDSLGTGQPITICPHCHKPKGSCPKCQA